MLLPSRIASLAKIASKDIGRYAFNGVRVERRGDAPRAIATDGRCLVAYSWAETDAAKYPTINGISAAPVSNFGAVIPSAALSAVAKGASKKPGVMQDVLLDESDEKKVRMVSLSARQDVDAVEGTFPPVDDVIPAADADHYHYAVNAKLLIKLLGAFVELTPESGSGVHSVLLSFPADRRRAMRINAADENGSAIGVLMPVGIDDAEIAKLTGSAPKAASSAAAAKTPVPSAKSKRVASAPVPVVATPAPAVATPAATPAPVPAVVAPVTTPAPAPVVVVKSRPARKRKSPVAIPAPAVVAPAPAPVVTAASVPATPAPAPVASKPAPAGKLTRREQSAARRDAFRELSKKFASMPQAERTALADKVGALPTLSGQPLSRANSALLSMQRPGVSMLGTFNQWIAAGRAVRKGERGLFIWSRVGNGSGPSAQFVVSSVFDVSQTDATESNVTAPDAAALEV